MPDNYRLVIAGLTTALAYNSVVAYRNRRKFERMRQKFVTNIADYNDLATKYNSLIHEATHAERTADYLANMLRENQIPIDEFDRIIMQEDLTQEES